MRRSLMMIAAAGLMLVSVSSGASALPTAGPGLGGLAEGNPLVEQARVFCYNRYTGRFLHWGHCRRRPVYRRVSRPRVYCYNRRTGRFLHWGSCRR